MPANASVAARTGAVLGTSPACIAVHPSDTPVARTFEEARSRG